jgi:hypothetical protein
MFPLVSCGSFWTGVFNQDVSPEGRFSSRRVQVSRSERGAEASGAFRRRSITGSASLDASAWPSLRVPQFRVDSLVSSRSSRPSRDQSLVDLSSRALLFPSTLRLAHIYVVTQAMRPLATCVGRAETICTIGSDPRNELPPAAPAPATLRRLLSQLDVVCRRASRALSDEKGISDNRTRRRIAICRELNFT